MAGRLDLGLVISAVDQATRPLQQVGASVSRLGDRAERLGSKLRGLGTSALPRLTLPIAAAGGFALRASGQMEQMQVGFESMLGDAEKARTLTTDLMDFSARTPFQLLGIGGATRQLLAAGVAGEEVIDRLGVLGDIAAGAQVPLEDMAQIYAKSMAKGKVQTEELNQLAERGVPILDALVDLAAKYGNEISKEDVYKAAEQGRIKFHNLEEALELLTAEGGVFHDQMVKQSQTQFGLWSTLKDNAFNALSVIGDKIEEVFGVKGGIQRAIDAVGEFTEWFKRLADERPGVIKLVFAIAAVAAVIGPALIALGLFLSGVAFVLKGFGVVVGLIAALFSPIGLLAAALAAAAWFIYENWDGVVAFFEGIWEGIKGAFPGAAQWFQDLWAKIDQPVEGMFGWVADTWDATLAWLSGPGSDQSVFDWLSAPVVGAFAWVGREWDVALEWIAAAEPWRWSWLSAAADGVFDWVGAQWSAALEALASTAIIGISLALPAAVDLMTWLTGVLAALTALIGSVDFARVGRSIGTSVRDGFLALIDLFSGEGGDRVGNAFVGLLGNVGALMITALKGALDLVVAFIDGAFATDVKAHFWDAAVGWISALLDGIAARWQQVQAWLDAAVDRLVGFLPDFVTEQLGIGGEDAGADAGLPSIPVAPPRPTLFGPGAGAEAAATRVGGEVKVVLEGLPPGSRIEEIRSDNSDVPIAVEAGFVLGGT